MLGAFADRAIVDTMTGALFSAGFVVTAVESKALAIARMMREYGSGLDPEKSYLVAIIDDSGLDFIIVRRGKLCFEYMDPWRDIADKKGEITFDRFKHAFALDLRQVIEFLSPALDGTFGSDRVIRGYAREGGARRHRSDGADARVFARRRARGYGSECLDRRFGFGIAWRGTAEQGPRDNVPGRRGEKNFSKTAGCSISFRSGA